MNYILVIWTIVAMGPHGSNAYFHPKYDWRPIGEFRSEQTCKEGAASMGYKDQSQYRCLVK